MLTDTTYTDGTPEPDRDPKAEPSDNGAEESAARAPDLTQWPSTTGPVTIQHKIEEMLSNGTPADMAHIIEGIGVTGTSAYKNVHRGVIALVKKGLVSPLPHPKDNAKKIYQWSYFVDRDEVTPPLPGWLTLDWNQQFYPDHDIGWRSKNIFHWYRVPPNWTLRIIKPKFTIGDLTDDQLLMTLQDACEHTGNNAVQFNATPMSNRPKAATGFEILGYCLSRGIDYPNMRSIAGRWLGQTSESNPTMAWIPEAIIYTEDQGCTLHPSIARSLANASLIPTVIPKGDAWNPGPEIIRQITKRASSIYRDMSFVQY